MYFFPHFFSFFFLEKSHFEFHLFFYFFLYSFRFFHRRNMFETLLGPPYEQNEKIVSKNVQACSEDMGVASGLGIIERVYGIEKRQGHYFDMQTYSHVSGTWNLFDQKSELAVNVKHCETL